MDRSEIFEGVRACLEEVLNVAPDSVREEAKIIGDLGADSLDLLELTFHLQQKFGVTISPRDIERRAKEKLGDVAFEVDGVYTPEGVRHLREAMPEVPADELPEGLGVADLPRTFRVATMVNLVSRLMEETRA
ncbi:MAG: acyl carrier protein [Planctomycetota bacterium]|jgi:acyl carrier protein